LGIVDRALFFAHRTSAFPGPIQHRRVIRHSLALLIVLMAWLTLCGQLHLHPILDRDRGRVSLPVALALVDNLERRPEPVDRLADQLVRRDRGLDAALAIRELTQIRHHIVPQVALLNRVVHAPIAPHACYIMMRDVAVEEEVAGQLLAEPGSALGLKIERLGWSDDFNIDTIGLRTDNRILHRAIYRCRPEVHVIDCPRAARPSDGPAVWMVTMEYFRSAMDQPEFGWITHVGTRNRRRRIAERIGAIAHRLVFESKVL